MAADLAGRADQGLRDRCQGRWTSWTCEVDDGEFVVLVGPSGCGKTTALRMVAGLEEITSGTVRFGDRVVNDVSPRHRDVAMVFQNYALYPHLTVRQNIGFALENKKIPKAERDRRVRSAADVLGLTELLDRKPQAAVRRAAPARGHGTGDRSRACRYS